MKTLNLLNIINILKAAVFHKLQNKNNVNSSLAVCMHIINMLHERIPEMFLEEKSELKFNAAPVE